MKSGLSNAHMIFEKEQEESDVLQNTIWSDAGRSEYRNMEVEVMDETIRVQGGLRAGCES